MRSPGSLLSVVLLASTAGAESYPFDEATWQIDAREAEFVRHLDKNALRIKGGYAQIRDLDIESGLLEFDIAVTPERGFAGAIFRVQDLGNYEHFYIRPHQSGNVDANQYTPVFNGVGAWQLYHGEGFGAPVDYRFDEWMHIAIAFRGEQAEVFIDSDEPVLIVDDLRRPLSSGGIGFGAGNFAPAWFANINVSPLPAGYEFRTAERQPVERDPRTIIDWQVSEAFAADTLPAAIEQQQNWTTIKAEPSGITNLAQAKGIGGGSNTVIARLQLDSTREQLKRLNFGYSDEVTVYVNGKPLYSGSNRYQSRDYRYLGTIGLFDAVHLPLVEGRNDIRFAISEAFGGWGIQAAFEDLDGIEIAKP